MATNFYELLRDGNDLQNMPQVSISRRATDKTIVFNPRLMRLDRIAGDVYQNESLYKILMWANPEIIYEFDIPRGTIIRIPFPLNDVIQEITGKIQLNKNR